MTTEEQTHECRDCGAAADPQFTLDFTDVEAGEFLYWCSRCGPGVHALNDALQEAFATRGLGFAQQLETAIDEAEGGAYDH